MSLFSRLRVKVTDSFERVAGQLKDARSWVLPQKEELEALAYNIEEQVRAGMMAAPPPPLAQRTKDLKLAKGREYPDRTWWDTGWLIEKGLDVKVKRGALGKAQVLILPSDKVHPPSGRKASVVFGWMEYGIPPRDGHPGQPPRPVLGPIEKSIKSGKNPALDEFREKLVKRIQLVLS